MLWSVRTRSSVGSSDLGGWFDRLPMGCKMSRLGCRGCHLRAGGEDFLMVELFVMLMLIGLPGKRVFVSAGRLRLSLIVRDLFSGAGGFASSKSMALGVGLSGTRDGLQVRMASANYNVPPRRQRRVFLYLSMWLDIYLLRYRTFISVLPKGGDLRGLGMRLFLYRRRCYPLGTLVGDCRFFRRVPSDLIELREPWCYLRDSCGYLRRTRPLCWFRGIRGLCGGRLGHLIIR